MRRAVVTALAVVTLAACGDPWEGTGVVVEKRYDDPDTWTMPGHYTGGTTTCSTINGNTTCRTTPLIWHPPVTYHDGPHWALRVRSDEDGKKHSVGVPESVWNSCQVDNAFDTATQECTPR